MNEEHTNPAVELGRKALLRQWYADAQHTKDVREGRCPTSHHEPWEDKTD